MEDALKLLSKLELKTAFPNLYKVYKAICTLSQTSETVERTFSEMKLIKIKHRSTMSE